MRLNNVTNFLHHGKVFCSSELRRRKQANFIVPAQLSASQQDSKLEDGRNPMIGKAQAELLKEKSTLY